jgi:alcohol dehydrogenase
LAERELVEPGFGQVRLVVEACGVCHTDSEFVEGQLPGLSFPVTPGHEVAGRIDVVGAGVRRWRAGDRVTVGWSGGHCGYCDPCRRGEFVHCEEGYITGATYPGGYAESMVVPASVEDTLNFAALHNIRPMVEQVPLHHAYAAYQRMLANQARFRVVLTTDR